MNLKLHQAWEAALKLCELLDLDADQLARGVPLVDSEMSSDYSLYRIQDRAVEAALLLREMVDRDERSRYWPCGKTIRPPGDAVDEAEYRHAER